VSEVAGDGDGGGAGARHGADADAARAGARQGADGEAELLVLACEAARMAGGLLLERVGRGAEREVSSKSTPTDLVSEADLASQWAIRELLRRRRPGDGFLGEEEGESEQGSSGLRWIVDPLDGTVNFLFQIPQWSVSIAVADEAGTIAGAVYDPNRDELFAATREGAATLRSADGAVELSRGPAGAGGDPERRAGGKDGERGGGALATAMVATGLAYDAEVRRAQGEVLARLAPRVRDIRRFGSAALDLCWTAIGRCDAYYERSVKQWDVAAGLLICERAGLLTRELPAAGVLPWGVLAAPEELVGALRGIVAAE
jgi:myo-inositol-1(or 4)-monophosphatase